MLRRALETWERMLGPVHPDTLLSIHNLAFFLDAKGDYENAEVLYRQVLERNERVLGKDHPDTVESQYNLELFLEAQAERKEETFENLSEECNS